MVQRCASLDNVWVGGVGGVFFDEGLMFGGLITVSRCGAGGAGVSLSSSPMWGCLAQISLHLVRVWTSLGIARKKTDSFREGEYHE